MRWLLAPLLITALALAGAESRWFPWPNLAGAILMLVFAALVGRRATGGER